MNCKLLSLQLVLWVFMSLNDEASFYEIVELENGDVALRKADDKNRDPLVTIRFSEESAYFLDDARFEVAKIMIEAGLDAVAEINDEVGEEGGDDELVPDSTSIH